MGSRRMKASVYVHIPFCEYRCRYCDFYFETGWSDRVMSRTLDRILEEARELRSQSPAWTLDTLYLGGGTPSTIPAERLRMFLGSLTEILGRPEREFTLEANPEGVTEPWLEACQDAGVDRISLGFQTFRDDLLAILGRRARRKISFDVLSLMGRKWKGRWNGDLIAGVPGQDWAALEEDLTILEDGGAGHLSLYALTLEPGSPLETMVHRGQARLADPEVRDELWIRARDWLVDRGFRWYEISNFARGGWESLHNLNYWALNPYAGLGPGAQGTWPETAPVRTSGPKLFPYLSGEASTREVLGPREFFLEHLMTGLRTDAGIPWTRLETRFPGFRRDMVPNRWQDQTANAAWVLSDEDRLVLDHHLVDLSLWKDTLELSEIRWPDEA